MNNRELLIEDLANYAHEAWVGWMKYLFSKSTLNDDGSFTIPPDLARRWARQVVTRYDVLPENEKESDRVEARKMLNIVGNKLSPIIHNILCDCKDMEEE